MKNNHNIITDLAAIAVYSEENRMENDAFIVQLKTWDADHLDKRIAALNQEIEPQIDCTKCGNCCKTLMINVTNEEADKMSAHLHMDRSQYDVQYLEKSDHSDRMVINQMPCHFLAENKCTQYDYRFEGCREFPALHKPGSQKRLFTLMMHYDRCPIIFNVMEALKAAL